VSYVLDRLLASRHFVHAPKKKRFLQLICDYYVNGRHSELNEYLIGREVFDRDDNYDPAADPIVRVAAYDVRKKLNLYYETEGASDEIRLDIPVGSYVPVFVSQSAKTVEGLEQEAAVLDILDNIPRAKPLRRVAVIVVIVLLASAVVVLYLTNRSLRTRLDEAALARDASAFGAAWEPFLKTDDLTLLVISNPAVFRFSNPVDPDIVMKKSVGLTTEQANDLAESLKGRFVMRQPTVPRLILTDENYTGMGEAIGLHKITDLFRTTGRGVLLRQSRTASAEDLKNHNVILLGSVWVNEWSGKLPTQEDFVYTPGAIIQNRSPRPGESGEYRPEFGERAGDLTVDYALVTVKPNLSNENVVMVLAGIHSEGTEAAAEFITSRSHLSDLSNRLRGAGGGRPLRYYQALLRVGVESGIPTTISLVALHELIAGK
jgi:hypothetical protein